MFMRQVAVLFAAFFFAQLSLAAAVDPNDDFAPFYNFVNDNLTGGLGVGLALLAFLISVVTAAIAQSGMPLVIGVIVAVALSFGPGLIQNMVTGGNMIPAELLMEPSALTNMTFKQ